MTNDLRFIFSFCGLVLCVIASNTYAQSLHLSADENLQWDQKNQSVSAIGNAVAEQENNKIEADKLIAYYQENPETGQNFDIQKMEGFNNITLTSAPNKAYGDYVLYDLPANMVTLTGSNLRIVAPNYTLKAKDKFTYDTQGAIFTAQGGATIIRPSDTMRADTLIAFMAKDKNGNQSLSRVKAQGHIKITTATETIMGQSGTYNAQTEMVDLTGDVVITRGPNILKGQHATVNLKTQISKLYGSANPQSKGRVTGTFYPNSQSRKDAPLTKP